MARLVRRQSSTEDRSPPDQLKPLYVSPRERRLLLVLTLIVSLNLFVICGALTFFALIFYG